MHPAFKPCNPHLHIPSHHPHSSQAGLKIPRKPIPPRPTQSTPIPKRDRSSIPRQPQQIPQIRLTFNLRKALCIRRHLLPLSLNLVRWIYRLWFVADTGDTRRSRGVPDGLGDVGRETSLGDIGGLEKVDRHLQVVRGDRGVEIDHCLDWEGGFGDSDEKDGGLG